MKFHRSALPAVACLFALGSVAPAQNQYVAFHSGAGNPSTNLYIYLAGTLQPITALNNVSGGTFQILPVPDGTKYYLIANGGAAVTAVEGNFSNPRTVAANVALAPTYATLQPDGRRLILVAGKVYFIDTGSDLVLNPNGLTVEGQAIDVVVNWDSTRAYILSRSQAGAAATVLTMVDLVNNFAVLGTITFPGNQEQQATGVILGPNGFLYLSAYARVYEIEPVSLKLTTGGELQARGYPSKGTVTADGKYILFPNRTPIFGGNSIMQLDLSNRVFSYDGASTSEVFSKFYPASFDTSPTKMYAYGSSGRLYDLTLGSQVILDRSQLNSIFQSGLEIPSFPNAAFSNEAPPRTLWVTRSTTNLDGSTSRQLIQTDLRDQRIQQQNLPTAQQLEMTFLSPGVTSGGSKLMGFNTAQSVTAGGQRTQLPLVARMVDNLGRGIYRGLITFSAENPAVIISSPQVVTGVDGWAQTYVTAPNVPGIYKVIANGGPGVTNMEFSITVPGIVGGGGGPGTLGGVFIFTGNGQLQRENWPLEQPMTVQILDPTGLPIIGQQVVWTQVKGFGLMGGGSIQNTTDIEGKAYLQLTTGLVPVPLAASQDVIEAATSFGKVTFYATTIAIKQPNGQLAGDAQVEYIYPNLGDVNNRNLTIEAGTTLKNAIGIRVADYTGQALENIGLQVTSKAPQVYYGEEGGPPAPPAGFAAICENNPLTNAAGNVTCDIKAGSKPGTAPLYVIVGSYRSMPPLNLTITVGKASKLRITAGQNQKAKANTQLAVPLQVQVTDLGDNPIAGAAVTWSRVGTVNFGTLTAERILTNPGGLSQNSFRTGTVPGKFQIRAQIDNPNAAAGSNPIFVIFDVEVDSTVGAVFQISGNAQEAGINSDFPNPLVVQVNDLTGAAISGVRVEFAAIGSGTISSNSETTDLFGRAFVRAKAGTQPGPLSVTATVGSLQTTFTLSVRPPTASVLGSDIVNSASLQTGLTPCGLATITGRNLLPGVSGILQPSSSFGQLPITLGPIASVTLGGLTAPIVRAVNSGGKEQIDIQTPCELQPGTTTVVINITGQSATTITNVRVTQYQPGIFEFDGTDGRRYAVAVKEDGSFVGPSNPAERGKTVRILMTGLGQTNPALGTNRAGIANQAVVASLIGGINDAGVRVVKAETVTGQIGNYLVELEIPLDTQAGPYQSIAVAIVVPGDLIFSNGAYIPIR